MIETLLHLSAANWARVLSLPLTFAFVVVCGWLTNQIARPRRPKPEPHAIDSSNYTPPTHLHTIDYDRSEHFIRPDGSVVAQCCVQGCPIVVRIGRDVVRSSAPLEV